MWLCPRESLSGNWQGRAGRVPVWPDCPPASRASPPFREQKNPQAWRNADARTHQTSTSPVRLTSSGVCDSEWSSQRLEPFPFRLNRNGALFLVLTRFSSREPVPTSLENALIGINLISGNPVDFERDGIGRLAIDESDALEVLRAHCEVHDHVHGIVEANRDLDVRHRLAVDEVDNPIPRP